jgi:hypothetical protein
MYALKRKSDGLYWTGDTRAAYKFGHIDKAKVFETVSWATRNLGASNFAADCIVVEVGLHEVYRNPVSGNAKN